MRAFKRVCHLSSGALFSLLSQCLCLPVALIWSGHTGGQSRNTLEGGLCLVHLKDKLSKLTGPDVALPAQADTDKAGKHKFVKRITIKYTDGAETGPDLSDYSGKGSGLVTTAPCDGCGLIRLRNVSLPRSSTNSSSALELRLTVPVQQKRLVLHQCHLKIQLCCCPPAAVFSRLRGCTDFPLDSNCVSASILPPLLHTHSSQGQSNSWFWRLKI